MTKYSIRHKHSAIRAEAVYFLHLTMPSVTFLRLSMSSLSAALLIFSFQFSVLFFHMSVARQHQHCGVLLVLTRERLWIDSNGKNKLDILYNVSLVVNFRRSVFIAELWRPDSQDQEILSAFFFFRKNDPYGKIFKLLFWKFSSPRWLLLLCSNVVKLVLQ